jgi:predicted dehydrogenase
MSTSYGPGRYDDQYELEGVDYPLAYVKWTENRNMQSFLALVGQAKVKLDPLISKEYPVDEAKSALNYLIQKPNKGIGVLLKYRDDDSEVEIEKHKIISKPALGKVKGKISVAFIGCGRFIQANHLPNIHKQKDLYHIETICDVSSATLKLLERKYQPQKITSDYKSVLSDPNVGLIVIGTRHDLHGKMVIEGLQAGKHVLVEKPLSMSMQELNTIRELYSQNDKQLMVGFNRRFSPLTQEIKDAIKNVSTPKFIIYRVNAGHIPKHVWVQDLSIGGGRIIGECCHFIDYIKYLVNKPIKSYSFSNIPAGQNGIEANDNLSINISFEDGSLGTLQYIAVGNTKLPKERVEVHFANKSIVLDDFKALTFYGINKKNIRFRDFHKGYYEEMTLFAQAINSGKELIEVNSIIETTEMTIKIQEELNG